MADTLAGMLVLIVVLTCHLILDCLIIYTVNNQLGDILCFSTAVFLILRQPVFVLALDLCHLESVKRQQWSLELSS